MLAVHWQGASPTSASSSEHAAHAYGIVASWRDGWEGRGAAWAHVQHRIHRMCPAEGRTGAKPAPGEAAWGAMLEPPATRDDTASIAVPSLVAGMCGEGVGTDAQSRTMKSEESCTLPIYT